MPFLSPALLKMRIDAELFHGTPHFFITTFLSPEVCEAAKTQNVSHVNCIVAEGDTGGGVTDGAIRNQHGLKQPINLAFRKEQHLNQGSQPW